VFRTFGFSPYSFSSCDSLSNASVFFRSCNVIVISPAVQEQYGVLVYHAIEYHDTLSLLCVSDDEAEWEAERPTRMGVKAKALLFQDLKPLAELSFYIGVDHSGGV